MKTKTLNVLVREALADNGYPIHFYLNYLHHGIRCLENLALDFDFGPNVKELNIATLSYDRVTLPADCIDVIGVFGIYGGQRKDFLRNNSLTKIYNEISSVKYPYTEDASTLPEYDNLIDSTPLGQTSANEMVTVLYPGGKPTYEYNVDTEHSELILGPGHGLTSIYLRYLAPVVSTSTANTVHPYAVDVIHAYINWKIAKADGSAQSKVAVLKDEYYNQKRIMRGQMSGLSIEQLYQILLYN